MRARPNAIPVDRWMTIRDPEPIVLASSGSGIELSIDEALLADAETTKMDRGAARRVIVLSRAEAKLLYEYLRMCLFHGPGGEEIRDLYRLAHREAIRAVDGALAPIREAWAGEMEGTIVPDAEGGTRPPMSREDCDRIFASARDAAPLRAEILQGHVWTHASACSGEESCRCPRCMMLP